MTTCCTPAGISCGCLQAQGSCLVRRQGQGPLISTLWCPKDPKPPWEGQGSPPLLPAVNSLRMKVLEAHSPFRKVAAFSQVGHLRAERWWEDRRWSHAAPTIPYRPLPPPTQNRPSTHGPVCLRPPSLQTLFYFLGLCEFWDKITIFFVFFMTHIRIE